MNVRTLGLFPLAVIIAMSGSTLIVGCSTESEEEQLSTGAVTASILNYQRPQVMIPLVELYQPCQTMIAGMKYYRRLVKEGWSRE